MADAKTQIAQSERAIADAQRQLKAIDSEEGNGVVIAGAAVGVGGVSATAVGVTACAAPAALGAAGPAVGLTTVTTSTIFWSTTTTIAPIAGRGIALAIGGVAGLVIGVGLTGWGIYSWNNNRLARAELQAQIAAEFAILKAKQEELREIQKEAQAHVKLVVDFEDVQQAASGKQKSSEEEMSEQERALKESERQLKDRMVGMSSDSSRAAFDIDWLVKMQMHLQQQGFQHFEEMLHIFQDAGILSMHDVTRLENISQQKTKQWKLVGLTDQDILCRMPIYWYTIDEPSVYSPISHCINRPTRSNNPKVPAALRFSSWLTRSASTLGKEFDFLGQGVRGIWHKFEDDAWDRQFSLGSIFTWHTARSVSTTADPSALKELLLTLVPADKQPDSSPLTIFTIQNCYGKDISSISHFEAEQEVLVFPGSVFKVMARTRGTPESSDLLARADQIIIQMQGNVLLSLD